MKAVFEIEELPKSIYESITDPDYSLGIKKFLDELLLTDETLRDYFETKMNAVAFGELSIRDFVAEFSNLLGVDPSNDFNPLISLIFEVFTEEAYQSLLEFDVNKTKDGADPLFSTRTNSPQKELRLSEVEVELERNPQIVQSKLLEALDSFDLLINEKGIVANEVEKYLRGETLARDLAPHLTAMLDRPVSYVTKIVESLDEKIFKPIQKQIAEQGTLDISDAYDYSVEGVTIKNTEKVNVSSKNIDAITDKVVQEVSFLPKNLPQALSQQKKDTILSDLLTQGGTPSGTSLLSQDVSREQLEKSMATNETPKIEKKYTIDPYREILE